MDSEDVRKRKKVMKPDFYTIDDGYSSHIGQRQQNQDALRVTSEDVSLHAKGRLFAVADGMGGHPGGELASRLACSGLIHTTGLCRQKRP